jgi:hypothetical protein
MDIELHMAVLFEIEIRRPIYSVFEDNKDYQLHPVGNVSEIRRHSRWLPDVTDGVTEEPASNYAHCRCWMMIREKYLDLHQDAVLFDNDCPFQRELFNRRWMNHHGDPEDWVYI